MAPSLLPPTTHSFSSFFLLRFCNYPQHFELSMASFIQNLHSSPQTSSQFTKLKKTTATPSPSFHPSQWATRHQQQIYASKLFQALRHSPPTSSSFDAKQVRETADRVLAVAAKGTMHWSRAILNAAGAKIRKKHKKAKVVVDRRLRRSLEINKGKKKSTVVERKLKVLRRLVPGCRKLSSYSNVLDEARDYIAALEMQVRSMTAVAEFLGGGSSVRAPPPAYRLGSNVDS
ncbi:hypothetical protein CXB51_029079 [Gossypium anomalum]|uniref:IBH1-like N-terminal domain-containing protein n=1 Tax=Gossypium anomalum TaxID=47600 RepID=A0A8J5YFU4_9ROSI|nr:hypothetical protein CXB51_029079 [Gossypium anomalum]